MEFVRFWALKYHGLVGVPLPEMFATVEVGVCSLFSGAGSTNYQTHQIYLGITSSSGVIPKGTKISWTICVSADPTGRISEVPSSNYSANGTWTLTFDQTSGTPIQGGCFTETIEFSADLSIGTGAWCAPSLLWTDIYGLYPESQISVTANAPTGDITSGGQGTLVYEVAKRYPSAINTTGRKPHSYVSKSGTQTCYPEVGFSQLLQSDGADDVVCYPSGTTITTARCTWGGTMCNSSSTGLCTPPYKAAVSGQTNIPAMC